jgi:hypothetical protein
MASVCKTQYHKRIRDVISYGANHALRLHKVTRLFKVFRHLAFGTTPYAFSFNTGRGILLLKSSLCFDAVTFN